MGLQTFLSKRYSDYFDDVARGYIPGTEIFNSFGRKATVGADSGILWPNGPFNIPPSGGEVMEIVSSSASDSLAGTGIRTVEIHYLTPALVESAITVVMNGLTPVTIPATIRFVECVHMVTYGTNKKAVGNISVRRIGGDAQVFSYIAAGGVRCSSSARMVPAGKKALIKSAIASSISGTAAAGTEIFFATSFFGTHSYLDNLVFIPQVALGYQDNTFGLNFATPFTIPEGHIFGLTFSCDKAAIITGSIIGAMESVA